MSVERRIGWAIFSKDGEMCLTARYDHAKRCFDNGYEVRRIEFDRFVPDFGEGDADVKHEEDGL